MFSTDSAITYIEDADKRPVGLCDRLVGLFSVSYAAIVVCDCLVRIPSAILECDQCHQQREIAVGRTSGEDILTPRIFLSIISLSSHIDSVQRSGELGPPWFWWTFLPSKITWIPSLSNFSARVCLATLVPLLASYMTTWPPSAKKSQICFSQSSETRLRSANVSGDFSPDQGVRIGDVADATVRTDREVIWGQRLCTAEGLTTIITKRDDLCLDPRPAQIALECTGYVCLSARRQSDCQNEYLTRMPEQARRRRVQRGSHDGQQEI